MALIISFEITGISRLRGTLYNGGKIPIVIYSFLFFSILRFDMRTFEAFRKFVDTGANIDDWAAENAPRVRIAAKKAAAKARREARDEAQWEVEHWRKAYEKKFDEAARYSSENLKMRYAIDILSAQRASKEG